jgi:hypothetical protein
MDEIKTRKNLCHIWRNCRILCPIWMWIAKKTELKKNHTKPDQTCSFMYVKSTTSAAIKKTKPNRNLSILSFFRFLNCIHLFAYFHSNTNVEIISVLQNSSNWIKYWYIFTQFHTILAWLYFEYSVQSCV